MVWLLPFLLVIVMLSMVVQMEVLAVSRRNCDEVSMLVCGYII